MAYIDNVLTAMRFDQEYSPGDLAAICHVPEDEIKRALRLLAKGGVIECTVNDRFVRNRKYKTKQRNLEI